MTIHTTPATTRITGFHLGTHFILAKQFLSRSYSLFLHWCLLSRSFNWILLIKSTGRTTMRIETFITMSTFLTTVIRRIKRFPLQRYFLRLHVLFCREEQRTKTLSVIYHKSSMLLSLILSKKDHLLFPALIRWRYENIQPTTKDACQCRSRGLLCQGQ